MDQVSDLIVRQNLQKADERLAALEAVTIPSMTDWVSYIPKMITGPTGYTFSNCFWRRVGDELEVKGTCTFSSHDGGASVFELQVIPASLSLTVDTTKIGADQLDVCGTMRYLRTGSGTYPGISLQRINGNLVFQPSYTAVTFLANMLLTGDSVSWKAAIPISQYAF